MATAKERIKMEMEHAAYMLQQETDRVRSKNGKEVHAEQLHYWDGKYNGLKLALNLIAKY